GYGWHVVRVESSTPGRLPELDEVEGAVRNAWIDERRAEFKRRAYERMRALYEVVLPELPAAVPAAMPREGGD
ncbi:MAG: peptidyl-prolyl cis-trans isomerase, partial [Thermodesulfobacteriota bacterium]